MGGHGGLNILPQKRWNVYNFDNREKVRLDEEAAAKEEQIKREQSRRRDSELRLEKLRQARGLASSSIQAEADKPIETLAKPSLPVETLAKPLPVETLAEPSEQLESDSKHINLFEGIKIFDPIRVGDEKKRKLLSDRNSNSNGNKKAKKEESVRAVGPEDEMYRMGYGVAGKGVKLPWYMEKKVNGAKSNDNDNDDEYDCDSNSNKRKKISGGKKSLEELREERLNREKNEKERAKALMREKSRRDGGFSSRRR